MPGVKIPGVTLKPVWKPWRQPQTSRASCGPSLAPASTAVKFQRCLARIRACCTPACGVAICSRSSCKVRRAVCSKDAPSHSPPPTTYYNRWVTSFPMASSSVLAAPTVRCRANRRSTIGFGPSTPRLIPIATRFSHNTGWSRAYSASRPQSKKRWPATAAKSRTPTSWSKQ